MKAAQKAFMDERVRPIRAEMKKIGPRAIADPEAIASGHNIIRFPALGAASTKGMSDGQI